MWRTLQIINHYIEFCLDKEPVLKVKGWIFTKANNNLFLSICEPSKPNGKRKSTSGRSEINQNQNSFFSNKCDCFLLLLRHVFCFGLTLQSCYYGLIRLFICRHIWISVMWDDGHHQQVKKTDPIIIHWKHTLAK